MKAIIVGGGVGGLTTALMLHARGIDCEVYEQSDGIRELGVGINTLPHAIKELKELGLLERLDAVAIRTYELFYLNRFGQEIWRELRGTDAGFDVPQFSIHRGRLQGVIYQAARARLGESRFHLGHRLGSFKQDDGGVTAYFFDRGGSHRATARGDVLIGADGIHSFVRETLFPNEGPAHWNGTMLWRGAVDWPQFLTGRSMAIAGGMEAKFVLYPIAAGTRAGPPPHQLGRDGEGLRRRRAAAREKTGRGPAAGKISARICKRFRLPYVDVEPPDRGDRRVLGISAVRPRSAAALVARARDAARRCRASDVSGRLERRLAGDPRCALLSATGSRAPSIRCTRSPPTRPERLPPTAQIVRMNRKGGPEGVIDAVETLAPDGFSNIDDVLSHEQRMAIVRGYASTAGFAQAQVNKAKA